MWEKEKLLVISNFSFSHSVFKRLELQTRKNKGSFGKGLDHASEMHQAILAFKSLSLSPSYKKFETATFENLHYVLTKQQNFRLIEIQGIC